MAVIFTAVFFISSCTRETSTEVSEAEELFEIPEHFPAPVYRSDKYPFTTARIQLGRRLFYDPILSIDSTISCGSCHSQEHGFADHNVAFSLGVNGAVGTRNSPSLSNLAWHPYYMSDGGINHLEVMPLAPITAENEMNQDMSGLLKKLNKNAFYAKAFRHTFSESEINSQQLFVALAQFLSTIVSANSKFDQFLLGKISLTPEENKGYDLFMKHCSSCHKPPLFTDFSFVNNGLDKHYKDPGRARITQLPQDSGAFKVPGLRNISLTYPYMHDGRFLHLSEVLDHYSEGVLENGKLDARLPAPLYLSEDEKESIIVFLQTLTDYEFISNLDLNEP